jgi:hypothetical protein
MDIVNREARRAGNVGRSILFKVPILTRKNAHSFGFNTLLLANVGFAAFFLLASYFFDQSRRFSPLQKSIFGAE